MLKSKKIITLSILGIMLVGTIAYAALGSNQPDGKDMPSQTSEDQPAENNSNNKSTDETNTGTDKDIDYGKPSDEEKAAGDDVKKETTDSSKKPDTSTQKKAVKIETTAVGQEGGTLRVRTLIQAVESDATCTITLSKNGTAALKRTVDVQPLASSATCKGFDLDVSDLAAGEYDMKITYNSKTSTGTYTEATTVR